MPENNLPSVAGCANCGKENKAIGALDLAKAVFSGKTTEKIATSRLAQCKKCEHKDADTGEKLFRTIDGKIYCGAPRIGWKIYRDDKRLGCGCNLAQKIWYNNAACPLGHWGSTKGTKEFGKE